MKQPHEILEIEPDADVTAIKRAYLKLARSAHPDAGGDPGEFIKLQAAYEATRTELLDGSTARMRLSPHEPHQAARDSDTETPFRSGT